jgi:hypothetical protein
MPTNACRFFYDCSGCGVTLKPRPGDCCVYCSYGDVKCPPIQAVEAAVGSGGGAPVVLDKGDPIEVAVRIAIHKRDLEGLTALLGSTPGLEDVCIGDPRGGGLSRTLIEIGGLRLRLSHARAGILAHGASGELDRHTKELIEDALESERDLASIVSSILRRLRSPDRCAGLATRPLNKYEEAHLDLARAHADELDACAVRLGRPATGLAHAEGSNSEEVGE